LNHSVYIILESILFVTALSTDALIASLAYGSNKIKIPFLSVLVISIVCTSTLGISLLFGSFFKPYIPALILKIISFLILFILGIIKLMDNIIKSIIDKYTYINKEIKFNLYNLHFILNVYANPKEADSDQSKSLSPKEAFYLAIALSIDSLAAGVGAAFGNVNVIAAMISSLLLSIIAIQSGATIGCRINDKTPFQLSWLSGALLIILAFFRFI
jgi:putative sporulation protein YtaF